MRTFEHNRMKETWRKGIKITDLKEGDIIYVKRYISGIPVNLECEFIKYEKGIVHTKVVAVERREEWIFYYFPEGTILKVRRKMCFLMGKDHESGIDWTYCHWFGK